jgi:hypothetical protein
VEFLGVEVNNWRVVNMTGYIFTAKMEKLKRGWCWSSTKRFHRGNEKNECECMQQKVAMAGKRWVKECK